MMGMSIPLLYNHFPKASRSSSGIEANPAELSLTASPHHDCFLSPFASRPKRADNTSSDTPGTVSA